MVKFFEEPADFGAVGPRSDGLNYDYDHSDTALASGHALERQCPCQVPYCNIPHQPSSIVTNLKFSCQAER
jgi:hypothetical protein